MRQRPTRFEPGGSEPKLGDSVNATHKTVSLGSDVHLRPAFGAVLLGGSWLVVGVALLALPLGLLVLTSEPRWFVVVLLFGVPGYLASRFGLGQLRWLSASRAKFVGGSMEGAYDLCGEDLAYAELLANYVEREAASDWAFELRLVDRAGVVRPLFNHGAFGYAYRSAVVISDVLRIPLRLTYRSCDRFRRDALGRKVKPFGLSVS